MYLGFEGKMILDFNKMEETVIPNFKGGEKSTAAKMYFDGKNRIMKGRLIPGATIGMHKHETSSEIVFILSGKGKMLYDEGDEDLSAGQCHYCPKGHTHSLVNNSSEDLVFYAVVPEQ